MNRRSIVLGTSIVFCLFVLEYGILKPLLVPAIPESHKYSFPMEEMDKEQGDLKRFTIVIVTFNEPLLEKTVNNVLNNSRSEYLGEVLIIDDQSEPPVSGWETDERVRILRPVKRQGLIGARIIGGNNARFDFIAIIDAHVLVSPSWLDTPHRLLSENPRTIVNFVNTKLNAITYSPMPLRYGVGSSATITQGFGIFWGGGSTSDDFSPITMGMFATTRFWWKKGEMDPGLATWGGENIEISLRTWLCGGRIVVAKDSFVAHAFRSSFPYKVNSNDIRRNNLRVASVWMEEDFLQEYYKIARIPLVNGVPMMDIGNITKRLELKKQLHCKPFSWYAEFFKGRALCQKGDKQCGNIMTVDSSDLIMVSTDQLFSKK